MSLKPTLFLIFLCGFQWQIFGQDKKDSGNEESKWPDEPGFFLNAGPTYSQFSGKAFPIRFPYQWHYQVGANFQFLLRQEYLTWTGLEFQMMGYNYDILKKGVNQEGKNFEQSTMGNVRIGYLNIPGLLQFPLQKPQARYHMLGGISMAFRVFYKEEFNGSFRIPADTLEIPIRYSSLGNDAFDFFNFNLCLGGRYALTPRWEIWLLAQQKVMGLSIGKENFATLEEINTLFSFKVVFRMGEREDWLRF